MSRRQALGAGAAALFVPGVGLVAPGFSTDASELRVPVLEVPDLVVAYVGDVEAQRVRLEQDGARWRGGSGTAGIEVGVHPEDRESVVTIAAAGAVQRVHLRWKRPLSEDCRVLGDAWERSYGDLEWLPVRAERPLPWYALMSVGARTSGFGVKVGAGAFAFWQVDVEGVSLWLDVRNGGNGVLLGKRVLEAARIRSYVGKPGENAFAVARALCMRLAEGVKVPSARGAMTLKAIYGSNDWYYAYGRNTAAGILRDAELMRELAPSGDVRPFTVIDDGYQDAARFPSMARLAEEIGGRGVVPGVWIRPLRAKAGTAEGMLLPAARWRADVGGTAPRAYDPTVPEGMKAVVDVVVEAREWGYRLIKHDFTTFELLGQWGSQMGASPALPGWSLHDRTRTNAEVIADLYREIRRAAGEDRVILGCNTVGHLSVGIFDAQRTGDDVSGKDWERTRRMGVNTLAYRMAQHRNFFAIDADCVAVTPEVPWAMTEQWLRVVAKSGSVLLVSPDPKAVGAKEKAAIREAFAACVGGGASEPGDWMESRTPRMWGSERYRWIDEEGASPMPIGVGLGEG